MIPFFIFYSMFGFQRVGDLIWAGADMRMKGFVLGGTAGRTTLNGEGLQHEDGQSHVLALPVPNCQSYDPAFAYELAVIIEDGIKRMYRDQEDIFYYLTLMNENYEMPTMPEGVKEGILKGMYRFRASEKKKAKARAQLLGSGAILNEVLGVFGIPAQKWLSDPTLAMPSIVAMSIWQGLGVNVIIFLAGLQGIPTDLLDAASVDGAGTRARFRHVTLPLLTPSIFFTGVLSMISAFQVFDQIFVLVKPRPTDATITVVYFIYENGFKTFKMGYASAASWVLFLIVALFTAIYFWSQRRWVYYQ